ncbi:MAG: gabD [Gammaproteobacteria bacterium]|jgi:succinate-semialdehyde dehydrogenase/glutarate-semialdehyde dehydrogenase|nr:gabD [Gammaproteobacteria bacterium]
MKKIFDRIEKALINGEWISAKSHLDVINPASREKIGIIPNLGPQETIQAINAASAAFPAWAKTPPIERANLLWRWHDLILKNKTELASLISLENGKSLSEAQGEIEYSASFVRWFAEQARRVDGDTIQLDQAEKRVFTIKQPVGVVGAITPWNFPSAMITRKCAPAFAAGCTVVLKPSDLTPFSALALAKLAEEAGFPKGVFNVITGDAQPIGLTLCEDARVRKISFTGSTRVGQWLMAHSADTVKRLSLELGGNAPFIIFEDADLDNALAGLMASKFRNSGQTCVCANRVLVHEKVYASFVEKLIPAVNNLTVGSALLEEKTQVGPLINQAGLDKVNRLVQDAINKGASCVAGGKVLNEFSGFFYSPTILVDVTAEMVIFQEEIFGPVVALYRFKEEAEAIELANNTSVGLAAYFYSQNPARIFRVAESLQSGMIGINTGIVSSVSAPFGGIKNSGLGKEGSKYGIEEYLQIKTLCWDIS